LFAYGNVLMEACTVSGNLAGGGGAPYYLGNGGGIVVGSNGPIAAATIRNSTVSGNYAWFGGGIAVGNATLVVQNSTITGNTATSYGGGGIGTGYTTTIALESSIVAKNIGFGGADIIASGVSARNSSVFDRTGIGTFNDLGGNRPAGEDPRLGPLVNNGGPTQTHRLLPGSPCVDAGSNPANLPTDQRGPGFPRVLTGAADMGAVEDVTPTATLVSVPATITTAGGTNYAVVVRYEDDIGIDPTTIDLSDITVTGPGYAVPRLATAFSTSGSGAVVTVTYTVPAPGGAFDFTDGGLYTVAMVANQVGDSDIPVHNFVAAGPLGAFRVAIPFTLTVDEPSDIDDGNTTQGHLSLREAIRLTNAVTFTSDTIAFDPALFSSPATIVLTAGQFTVTDPLTVIGPGAGLLTLDAGGASRHFNINAGISNPVRLSGLTLINGSGNGGGAIGGQVGAVAQLNLSDVVISNCRANPGYAGGAIVIIDGSLTMLDCTVSNNMTSGATDASGGGIYVSVSGPVVLERSTFADNQASGRGGGLMVYGDNQLQISGCTFSNNRALSGGGISVAWLGNGSFIRNSTISGNTAVSYGGGVDLNLYGTLAIANSTITGNTASSGGGIAANFGYYEPGELTLSSAIVAGNSAGPDVIGFGSFGPNSLSGNNNLIGVANSGGLTLTGAGNLTGTLAAPLNPMLAPLAENGGPTKTHALLPGSPAIDAGNNSANLPHDQRGSGFTRVVGAAADIGAFEVQAAVPPTGIVRINDGAAQRSRITDLTVTFSAQVTFAGAVSNAFTLVRTGGGSVNFSATANVVGGVTVVTLNGFTGSETQFGSLRDGRYTLTALASQISAGGLVLDGDGDGQPGGNLTFGDAQGLFRFYGDINGDRHVDIADFGLFSATFNLSTGQSGFLAAFDFNGDGHIDIADFGQFSIRFFTMLP
jgi:hypothetical protein